MNTTELINHIESLTYSSALNIQTYSIDSNVVNIIRRCIRNIYSSLFESDEENSTAAYLRLELLKLQTSPSIPSLEILSDCGLDDRVKTKKVWGQDISNICIVLGRAIQTLNEYGSPLMRKLVEVVTTEIENHGSEKIKIWCHRKERKIYIKLFANYNINLTDVNFISSLAEYRKIELFEVLIRLGPLRSQGWSKTPRVILSAPRYSKLIQLKWEGSLDESEFGVDPVVTDKSFIGNFSCNNQTITAHIPFDDIQVDNELERIDDFYFLSERPLSLHQGHDCVLIEFHGNKGVLLVPGSHQLIFDCNADKESLVYKDAHEIESSNFLLLHDVEADLGANEANKANKVIAPLWKQALSNMYHTHYQVLIAKMRSSGINLIDLDRAAKMWMKSGGEVVYGPQNKIHFQLLIKKVLPYCLVNYTWRQAWQEIQDSRVQAIQDGRIESVIANEQLIKELHSRLKQLIELCSGGNFFIQNIKPDSGVSGIVKFYPVIDVSPGFKAPNDKLGTIYPISELEIYRTDI